MVEHATVPLVGPTVRVSVYREPVPHVATRPRRSVRPSPPAAPTIRAAFIVAAVVYILIFVGAAEAAWFGRERLSQGVICYTRNTKCVACLCPTLQESAFHEKKKNVVVGLADDGGACTVAAQIRLAGGYPLA